MNPRKLSRIDLVTFAQAAAAAVAEGKVTGLSPAQAVEIWAAIGDAADTLAAANAEQTRIRAAYLEHNQQARESEELLNKLLTQFKFTMVGMDAPDDQFVAVGFDPPAHSSAVVPEAPTELAVRWTKEGIPVLTWNGNNAPGRVNYIIEAAIDGDYRIVGASTKQKFKLEHFVPGKPHRYRVYAQSAKRGRSDPSNETVI
jgi:hypothetical protein